MKMLSPTDFFAETMGGRANKMDMSPYQGHLFRCSCGQEHMYVSSLVEVLRELSDMRLIFKCPENSSFATCVKVKGLFRFKGFESLYGTKIENETEATEGMMDAIEKKIGFNKDEN